MPNQGFANRIAGQIDINILFSFVFGVVFLGIMLGFSVGFPNPTPIQVRVFITALALAASGVGAILPGYFDIRYKSFIRAGGALGLFALVYLNQPNLERQAVSFVAPPTSPEPIALTYLAAIDNGNLHAAWDSLDPVAHGVVFGSLDQLTQLYETYRKPLGSVVKRELTGTGSVESPSGYPVGLYRNLVYRTKYSNTAACRTEGVTLRATQDLKWRVFGHTIGSSSIEG